MHFVEKTVSCLIYTSRHSLPHKEKNREGIKFLLQSQNHTTDKELLKIQCQGSSSTHSVNTVEVQLWLKIKKHVYAVGRCAICDGNRTYLSKSSIGVLHISPLIIKIVWIAATVLLCTEVISHVYKLVCHTFLLPLSVGKLLNLGALSRSWVWGLAMDTSHVHAGAKTLGHSISLYLSKLLFSIEMKPKCMIWGKKRQNTNNRTIIHSSCLPKSTTSFLVENCYQPCKPHWFKLFIGQYRLEVTSGGV